MKRIALLVCICLLFVSCGGGGTGSNGSTDGGQTNGTNSTSGSLSGGTSTTGTTTTGGSTGSPIDPSKIVVETARIGTHGAQIQGAADGIQVGNIDGNGATFSGTLGSAQLLPASQYRLVFTWFAEGTTKVGRGVPVSAPVDSLEAEAFHALVWTGATNILSDIHPSGYYSSEVRGINGSQKVGYGRLTKGGQRQPLLWTGSSSVPVNLMPDGADSGTINSVRNNIQAGSILYVGTTTARAATWNGTKGTYADRHAWGFTTSSIFYISDTDMVGTGSLTSVQQQHALRWVGNQVIDLHPPGKYSSQAFASDGNIQVGWYQESSESPSRACLWQGSAESFVDLGVLLPAESNYTLSHARGIVDGVVYGFAYPTDSNTYGESHAVIWRLPTS